MNRIFLKININNFNNKRNLKEYKTLLEYNYKKKITSFNKKEKRKLNFLPQFNKNKNLVMTMNAKE
jgi:hypothetical protein